MQENTITLGITVSEEISDLRALGRYALRGAWKPAILASFIYLVCTELPPIVFDWLFGANVSTAYGMLTSPLSAIYTLVVSGAFALGMSLFFLDTFRGHDSKGIDVFLGFDAFGKTLGLILFQALFVFLWSLLLVVLGIIAAIRYSQAFFILADDPRKGIRQCVNESKVMMQGNKGK